MKKVGIISLYYKNYNYGGLLQAYALQKIIEKIGCEAEQISWDFYDGLMRNRTTTSEKKSIIDYVKNAIINFITLLNRSNNLKRTNKLNRFEDFIPHSKTIYTYNNIHDSVTKYDIFITGSDQVWDMSKYNPEQFLCFVPDSKLKISYAASMPDTALTLEQKEIVKKNLNSFHNISVREKSTADQLAELLKRDVKWVLDPTLVLERSEWDKISVPYNIEGKYIFCYFLSGRSDTRKIADVFAEQENLRIATFSHLGCTNISDMTFGDYKIYDADPGQFLTLIKNAEYVLTDSFHATVFSYIYKTKFFVFSRAGGERMNSRITSLLEIFRESDRFCIENKFNLQYLLKMKDRIVKEDSQEYILMKKDSVGFLTEILV